MEEGDFDGWFSGGSAEGRMVAVAGERWRHQSHVEGEFGLDRLRRESLFFFSYKTLFLQL